MSLLRRATREAHRLNASRSSGLRLVISVNPCRVAAMGLPVVGHQAAGYPCVSSREVCRDRRGEQAACRGTVGRPTRVRLADQLKRLVRDEIKLATFEMRANGKRMGAGTGLLGVASVIALLGGATLVVAAVLALALVMAGWLSALLVRGALVVPAGLTALVGRHEIVRAVPPVPEEAIAGVREDMHAIQRGVRS
jgi:hypothetical protein